MCPSAAVPAAAPSYSYSYRPAGKDPFPLGQYQCIYMKPHSHCRPVGHWGLAAAVAIAPTSCSWGLSFVSLQLACCRHRAWAHGQRARQPGARLGPCGGAPCAQLTLCACGWCPWPWPRSMPHSCARPLGWPRTRARTRPPGEAPSPCSCAVPPAHAVQHEVQVSRGDREEIRIPTVFQQ